MCIKCDQKTAQLMAASPVRLFIAGYLDEDGDLAVRVRNLLSVPQAMAVVSQGMADILGHMPTPAQFRGAVPIVPRQVRDKLAGHIPGQYV